MPRVLKEIISHGWLGVDLFFILSGFLITGILIDSRGTQRYFRNFYVRRILRIVPLYWTCIFVMFLAYRGFAAYFGLSLLFLANFNHYFHVSEPHGPGVFWSLSIEEHFYLVWPLLVNLLSRTALLALSLATVFGTPILRGMCAYWGMDPELEIYAYSFFRFDGLALGAILAIWVRSRYYNRESAWWLACALAGSSLLVTVVGLPYGIMQSKTVASSAFRYTQAQFFFAATMALSLAYRGSVLTSLLRSSFAKVTANLSYCMYLIHLALGDLYYWVLRSIQFDELAHFGAVGALAVRWLVLGTATFGLAALSKKFLEDPFLRLKRYF